MEPCKTETPMCGGAAPLLCRARMPRMLETVLRGLQRHFSTVLRTQGVTCLCLRSDSWGYPLRLSVSINRTQRRWDSLTQMKPCAGACDLLPLREDGMIWKDRLYPVDIIPSLWHRYGPG